MKLRLIPASLEPRSQEHYQYLTSCLLNDTVVIDAGSIGFWRSPADQARIRHVLITHTHMDHIASLPVFVENAYEGKSQGVTIHASTPVLESLQHDLFNNRIWPDFVALSQEKSPFLHLEPLNPGDTVELEGLQIRAVSMNHVVPTSGFLVSDANATVAFLSDTGPTESVWEQLKECNNLKAVFIETTFPDSMTRLAEISLHLTPTMLRDELKKLVQPTRIIVLHLKARYQEKVTEELQALNLPGMELARFGFDYNF